MKKYVDKDKLQEFATKMHAKQKTIFAAKSAETDIDNLETEIASLQAAVGSPLVASLVADMIDTDKIYVYVGSETGYTSGNWYYYDGTAWTSGGVYNAVAIETDDTLTVEGMAADAKAVGDKLSDFVDYTKMVDTFIEQIGGFKLINNNIVWKNGNINPSAPLPTTGTTSSTTRCCDSAPNAIVNSNNNKSIYVECPINKKVRVTFWTNASSSALIPTDSNTNWTTGGLLVTVPSNASYYRVSIAYNDNSSISPADCADVSVFEIIGEYSNSELFSEKKISILGDSISTFAGTDPESAGDGHTVADGTYTYAGNHCRYPNAYLSDVNNTYWKKLIDSLGLKLGVNDSWAGSRVSWDGTTESSDVGADKYIASPTRIGHLDDNGTPDIILVNAGTNDIGLSVTVGTFNTESPKNYTDAQIAALSVATFADAYRAMLIRLQKAYPLAKIVVMLPNYTTSYYNPENADKYLEIIKEECDYFGVPWVDMRTTGFNMWNTGTYTDDGIHPNVAGMQLLSDKLIKFFKYTL